MTVYFCMQLNPQDVFVILRWPPEAGMPRYSFATTQHASEIQMPVERVQTCATLHAAAQITARLNAEEKVA